MTDLSIVRGDSKTFRITVVDTANAPIDLTDSIVKFAFAKTAGLCEGDKVFKASYYAAEVLIDDPVNGRCLVYLLTQDTIELPARDYVWDLEVTRRGATVTSIGTITVSPDSGVLVGDGSLVLSLMQVGDILVPAGGGPENQVDVTISEIGGSGSDTDPGAGNLRTDYTGWSAQSGIALQVFRSNRKTPSGLSGVFTIEPGVVD
jgi:hypothetical protein